MALHDLTSQRLFLDVALAAQQSVICMPDQAHYLRSVLRMADGAAVLVFNGRDGEWRAVVRHEGKRGLILDVAERIRPQMTGPDIEYWFAPLKRARLDYVVQKATEMGVRRLAPVITRRTVAERVNLDRMRANVIEAAEQCGVLHVPDISPPVTLVQALDERDTRHGDERRVVVCDEAAERMNPIEALSALTPGPLAVLIGPEGGFADEERATLLSKPYVTAISLGPRIMRADTAAVAALALLNATLGDWR